MVVRVRCVSGELVTIASLNTRGIPLTGAQLAERYAVIGAGFDAGDADVVCCQSRVARVQGQADRLQLLVQHRDRVRLT